MSPFTEATLKLIKQRRFSSWPEALPANLLSPSSDTHIPNTQSLPSSEETWGMLGPFSKLPRSLHSTHTHTHSSDKHTAEVQLQHNDVACFDIVCMESRVRLVAEGDDGPRENTYSHLMPEQTWDSNRAVSTPRGRTGELLLMVGQRLQFTQGTNKKRLLGRLNSQLS